MDGGQKKLASILGEKYAIKGPIGEGGMGKIYLGIHRVLDKKVAIKIVHQTLRQDEKLRQRFCREAKLAAGLDHPGIIDIYDFGSRDNLDYIIMPYVEGDTLKTVLESDKKLDLQRCLDIIISATQALAYAHDHHVVHRDIKPSNILIDKLGQVILTDFGISKSVQDDTLTAPEAIIGSPKYISPEQVMGKKADLKSDLYALGLVFYEMITGSHPFSGTDVTAMLYHQTHTLPPKPQEIDGDIPPPIGHVIMRLLDKSPEKRYQNGHALLKELKHAGAARFPETPHSDLKAASAISSSLPNKTGLPYGELSADTLVQAPAPRYGAEGVADTRTGLSARFVFIPRIKPKWAVMLILFAACTWGIWYVSTDKKGAASGDGPASGAVAKPDVLFEDIKNNLRLLGHKKPASTVELWLDKSSYKIGESITYRLKSEQDTFITVLLLTTDNGILQLFPNRFSTYQLVQANQTRTIPAAETGVVLEATGPPGEEEVIILAGNAPFDLLPPEDGDAFFRRADITDKGLLESVQTLIKAAARLDLAQKRLRYTIR